METTSIKICFQHLFLPKLSGLRCVSYQAIRTKNNQGVFHQRASLHPVAKFTMTLLHKLSGLLCVSYHDIHIKVIGGIFHHLYSSKLSWSGCISYQISDVWVTMLFTPKDTGDISSTPIPTPKLSGLSYISYQVRDMQVIRSMMGQLPCYSHKKWPSGCFINSPLTPTPARKLIGCYQLETHETRYHDDCMWVITEIQEKN